jgi:hypothetical protein
MSAWAASDIVLMTLVVVGVTIATACLRSTFLIILSGTRRGVVELYVYLLRWETGNRRLRRVAFISVSSDRRRAQAMATLRTNLVFVDVDGAATALTFALSMV